MGSETILELPVLDFTTLNDLDPNTSDWVSTCAKVQQAFVDYGCFVVKYDEVGPELHNRMLDELRSVFDNVSDDIIRKQNTFEDPWWFVRSSMPHGGTTEVFNLNNATSLQGVTSLKDFVQTVWPHGNEGFCDTFLSYAKMLEKLEQIVVKLVLKSYGLDKYWENHVESMTYNIQNLKYGVGATQKSSLGLKPHTDIGFVNIVDTNHVKGLEIETKDGGQWIDYKPAPGHVIVIAGDAFFGWSNGRIHSPIHKVVHGGNEDRYTIKFSSYFRDLVEVPKELVDDEHPLLFKPFPHLGFAKFCRDKGYKSIGQDKNIKNNDLKTYCGI